MIKLVLSHLKKNKTKSFTTNRLARFLLRLKMGSTLSMKTKTRSSSAVTMKKVQRLGHELKKPRTKISISRKKKMKVKGLLTTWRLKFSLKARVRKLGIRRLSGKGLSPANIDLMLKRQSWKTMKNVRPFSLTTSPMKTPQLRACSLTVASRSKTLKNSSSKKMIPTRKKPTRA